MARDESEKLLTRVADGKALLSISRANLPDTVEVAVNQAESSQDSSATDEISDPEPKMEAMRRCQSAPRMNLPPPIFAPGLGADVSANNMSPNPTPTTPTYYDKQHLLSHQALETAFDNSLSAQELKRKRQCVETNLPATTSPTSLAFHSPPIFVGSQPLMAEVYEHHQTFQPPVIPLTMSESFEESVEDGMLPYFFNQ